MIKKSKLLAVICASALACMSFTACTERHSSSVIGTGEEDNISEVGYSESIKMPSQSSLTIIKDAETTETASAETSKASAMTSQTEITAPQSEAVTGDTSTASTSGTYSTFSTESSAKTAAKVTTTVNETAVPTVTTTSGSSTKATESTTIKTSAKTTAKTTTSKTATATKTTTTAAPTVTTTVKTTTKTAASTTKTTTTTKATTTAKTTTTAAKTTTAKTTTTKKTTTASSGSSLPYDSQTVEYINEVVRLVNEYRAQNGIAALTLDTKLTSAAMTRAKELITSFSHTRPNGTSSFTALKEAGVSYTTAGENIAAGQPTPQDVVNAWINSDGHRKNILNANFTRIGVGFIYDASGKYVYYWSQEFAG